MTNTRVFSMNLTANDTDPNMTTNVPTDGVGKIITRAIITATGTGVSVSGNAGCGQAAVGTSTARASIANNCNGRITVTMAANAPVSPISLTYKALDNLGGQSTAKVDTITVK
jgi:hypothetical protein